MPFSQVCYGVDLMNRHLMSIVIVLSLVFSYYLGYLRGAGVLSEGQMRALVILIASLVLISIEFRDKNVITLSAVVLLMASGIISSNDIKNFIDLDVLGLVFGMMILSGALQESGFTSFISSVLRRSPHPLLLTNIVTFIISGFVPNVVAVLLMAPMALSLGSNPVYSLMTVIIAANGGGLLTLTGDFPNIIVASAAKVRYVDFFLNMAPLAVIIYLSSILGLKYSPMLSAQIKPEREEERKRDAFFYLSLTLLFATISAMILSDFLNVKPSEIALLSSFVVLSLGYRRMSFVLRRVDWNLLIFISTFYVITGAVEKTGLLELMASSMAPLMRNTYFIPIFFWLNTAASATMDNIPVAIVFSSMLSDMKCDIWAYWWGLIAATAIGGLLLPISNVANLAALSIAEERGIRIGFKDYTKMMLLPLLASSLSATLYILIYAII
ncbi:MAG: SLC13 family permease [Candidatus Methanodesulfokora sp.]